MSLIISVVEDSKFRQLLSSCSSKLVVVEFFMRSCGSCQRMEPVLHFFSEKYPLAVFIKVDIEKCPETAKDQGIQKMPTFVFYKNGIRIDLVEGNDQVELELRINNHYPTRRDVDSFGHVNLNEYVLTNEIECLNESDKHPIQNLLTDDELFLESDCDNQLILSLSFKQPVRLHSLILKAPVDKGPKDIKLFINQPQTLDFEDAERNTPLQELSLEPGNLEGNPVPLKYVKFQNVSNLQIFIKNNQSGDDVTQIRYLEFIGFVASSTNMNEFKRLAGKKGEIC